jgi:hypothetical protein
MEDRERACDEGVFGIWQRSHARLQQLPKFNSPAVNL